jgi:hemerythrin
MAPIHSDLLWYSTLSTGIFEIYNQHGNIDMMLQLLEKSHNPLHSDIELLVQTIEDHFKYEESLFMDRFPEDHRAEHTLFLEILARYTKRLEENCVTQTEFISVIRNKLIEHADKFDRQLRYCL